MGDSRLDSMEDLFWMGIGDLHSAETQLTKALPKVVEKARDVTLRNAIEHHLEITRGQLARLGRIYDQFGRQPDGETCKAMEGLISECEHVLEAKGNDSVRDAGIIAAAQRVEHYEISGYGTARAIASRLGYSDAAALLEETLAEEKDSDILLTRIAESQVNQKAARA